MAQDPNNPIIAVKLAKCPCSWCQQPNNLKDLVDLGLEAGTTFECDHCGRKSRVLKVDSEPTVYVRRA
jgi:hypothetical protein